MTHDDEPPTNAYNLDHRAQASAQFGPRYDQIVRRLGWVMDSGVRLGPKPQRVAEVAYNVAVSSSRDKPVDLVEQGRQMMITLDPADPTDGVMAGLSVAATRIMHISSLEDEDGEPVLSEQAANVLSGALLTLLVSVGMAMPPKQGSTLHLPGGP